MREGWEYKRLGEVCEIFGRIGFRGYKREDYVESEKEGAISLSPSNIIGGHLDYSKNTYISWYKYEESPEIKIFEGDVLLVKTASVGKSAIVRTLPHAATINPQFVVFKNIQANNQYLFYSINSEGFLVQLKSITSGSSVPTLSQKALAELQIPLPPLPLQQSIVAELDQINNLLSLKRKELETYDKLAQSLFYEMFGDPVENEKGWKVNKLGDNVHEMFLGPFGSALKVDSYVPASEAYAMVYEQKHAIQATLSLENHFINEEKYRSLERFEVKGGDFIMSCRGTIGKIYRVPLGSPRGIIHPSLMKIRIKENVYDPMFFRFMLEKVVKNQTTKGNCVQMAITAKELGYKLFPLPPLPLQQLFAQRIEAIEEQKANVKTAIEKLETLLAARMQYWFD